MKKGKSINGLMKHIRNQHNIEISGSKNKKTSIKYGLLPWIQGI